MLGICFRKAPPTVHVMHYVNGVVRHEGKGLSLWYFEPDSTIVEIPLSSKDVPFVLHEVTADFQDVSLQGQLTFRVVEPAKVAQLLDFSIDRNGAYASDESPEELLGQRLINLVLMLAREVVQHMSLREALVASAALSSTVLDSLKASEQTAMLGVEVIDLSILSIKPTPEMARALEAEAREHLQGQADQAIYARRNAAVEEERRIKESELNTEIAVEAKRRQIRETKMAADIALEEQRAILIDQQILNNQKDADSRAYALEATLRPLRDADWRTLMAVAAKGGDAKFAISLAFQQLAENASKIGQLNVSPDLLTSLLAKAEK